MFQRSWSLVKASAAVLSADKELMVFPAISAVLSVVVLITFAVPSVLAGLFDSAVLADSGFPLAGYVVEPAAQRPSTVATPSSAGSASSAYGRVANWTVPSCANTSTCSCAAISGGRRSSQCEALPMSARSESTVICSWRPSA